MKTTDKAIFIHRSPYSSNSLITTFYTEKNGLQRFIFKGGKKKSHALFPLAISEISYYGRNSELLNLTDATLINPLSFQFNPIKSTIAYFAVEVLQKCVQQGDPDLNLFNLMVNEVDKLEDASNLHLFPIELMIQLAYRLGIYPLVDEENMGYFNLDTGSYQHTDSQSQRCLSGDAVTFLKQLLLEDPTETPNKTIREEALTILLNYFSIHIPNFKNLKSYSILKEVLD